MKADKIDSNVVPKPQPKRQSKQAFQMVDSRPLALAQAKLIHSISSGLPIQRAVSYGADDRNPSAPRGLYISNTVETQTKKIIVVKTYDGFGQNYGLLNGAQYWSHGSGHSEPNLISTHYGGQQGTSVPDAWAKANAAVTAANTNAGGLVHRAPFNLYTERKPCLDCRGAANLGNGRYKAADIVSFRFGHYDDKSIAEQYQTAAEAIVTNSGAPVERVCNLVLDGTWKFVFTCTKPPA